MFKNVIYSGDADFNFSVAITPVYIQCLWEIILYADLVLNEYLFVIINVENIAA